MLEMIFGAMETIICTMLFIGATISLIVREITRYVISLIKKGWNKLDLVIFDKKKQDITYINKETA